MSPPDKTSLVAEIPIQQEDRFSRLENDKLIQVIRSQLIQIGYIKEEEIIDTVVSRINYGYPILEIGVEEKIQKINIFLKGFCNLNLSGRSCKFMYSWIHDMMKFGKEIIEKYISHGRN